MVPMSATLRPRSSAPAATCSISSALLAGTSPFGAQRPPLVDLREWIQTLPSRAKGVSGEALCSECAEPLQQCRIMDHEAPGSDEDAVAKLGDHVADLVGPPFLDQFGRSFPAQQLLARKQP